jgi:putative lipoprotein
VLYDCGQEFERHADQSGWVRVLVQNNRDGRLLNMPIQLDPRHEAITGSASFRDRVSLPRDATLTVELREVYRTSLQPVTVAQQTFEARQSPIPFNLEFDPAQVDSRRQYVLYASIRGQGRQLYALRQEVPVLGGSGSTGLQLVLDSTQSLPGSTTSPNDQLAQITQWFRDYLGREPRSQELYVWESHLARGGTLEDAQLQILSTPEFYYQANADDTEYVRRMFLLVANRQPSAQEVDQWLRRLQYHNRMRSEMAREFLQTAAGQNSAVRRR